MTKKTNKLSNVEYELVNIYLYIHPEVKEKKLNKLWKIEFQKTTKMKNKYSCIIIIYVCSDDYDA